MSLDGYNAFLKRNQLDRKTYQEEGIEWCLNIETDGKRLGDQLIPLPSWPMKWGSEKPFKCWD